MKKIRLVGLVVGLIVGLWGNLSAEGFFMIDGSYGGKYDKGGIGFEIGKVQSRTDEYYGWLASIGISGIFVDETPSSLLDYPCPHSYRVVGDYANQSQIEGFLKGGIETIKNLFLIAGAGCVWATEARVSQSLATGWYYTESKRTKVYGSGMGELRYIRGNWLVGLGYHSRRGVYAGFGGKF